MQRRRGVTRIARKWRPPLWLVVAVTLGVVLCLPMIGIVLVRLMWPVLGYREAVYVAGFGVLAATFGVGWVLWRVLLRPVIAMRERVAALRAGHEDALDPLLHYGTSDMQALGQSFLDLGRAAKRREIMLRSFAAHVSHELKSPITVVGGAAELLGTDGLPEVERTKLLAKIHGASERMTTLLNAQRDLVHAEVTSERGEVRLSDVAQDIEILQDGDVPLSEEALRLVLDHLIGNARAHGANHIRATFDGRLIVQDDGTGISAGNASRIFEPFFTTRRAEDGTGMGLAIVRRVLEAHDAEIALEPSETGARFVITF